MVVVHGFIWWGVGHSILLLKAASHRHELCDEEMLWRLSGCFGKSNDFGNRLLKSKRNKGHYSFERSLEDLLFSSDSELSNPEKVYILQVLVSSWVHQACKKNLLKIQFSMHSFARPPRLK